MSIFVINISAQRPWFKVERSESLFLLFKKEIGCCEVGLFASPFSVYCKERLHMSIKVQF